MSTDPMKVRLNAGNSTLKLFPSPGQNKTKTLKDSKSGTLDSCIVAGINWNMPSNFFTNSVAQKKNLPQSHCLIWQHTHGADKQASFVGSIGKLVKQRQQLNWLMSIFKHQRWSIVVRAGSQLPTLVYLLLYLMSRVIDEVKRIGVFFSLVEVMFFFSPHVVRFWHSHRCSIIDAESVTTVQGAEPNS